MPSLSTVPVAANNQVGPVAFLLRAAGDFAASPGQFYLLRAWDRDPLLSRPMSVFDREDGQLTFLIFVRGPGTQRLAQLRPGDPLTLFGPLGKPLPRREGRIALVGGGSGIAPLRLAAKEFRAAGEVDVFLGFRDQPFLVSAFQEVASRVSVASELVAAGTANGLVTDIFDPHGYDACYACGPDGMLKAVGEACRSGGVPLWVLREERMACGVGACRGCAVRTVAGFRMACRDGPAFLAEEVIWNG
ncbi:TPA: dihydroorotate dehydrogenase electron transfer subunit [Candidatus Acetothermia bacterium]|nr:dihydroorotate dehydrogenase electron transfer subunit [Candidatus Acetothermia bacterium]HAZ30187.1 dihydroorotate dehydrogenase electron transfer subunit [Candidatus Acetothermia bacterium]